MNCKNVVKLSKDDGVTRALDAWQGGAYLVNISCADPLRFDQATDEDVWRTYEILEATHRSGVSKARLAEMQTQMGFNLNQHGVLADLELRDHVRPCSCLLRDSMHTFLAGGIVNSEIGLLLGAIAECTPGFTFQVLKALAEADWHWFPGTLSRAGFADMFNVHREKAWKDGGVFRAGASELLLAYPFIRYFVVEHVPVHKIPLERQSFLCLCSLMDLINEAKHYSTPHRHEAEDAQCCW